MPSQRVFGLLGRGWSATVAAARQRASRVRNRLGRRTVDESVCHGARLLRSDVRIVDRGEGVFQHGDWAPSGVTDQFLSEADTYHDRYFNRLDFLDLADQCLIAAAVDSASPIRVLDIGSGGGSSVFALAKLLPNAEVVASDISPQLLHKLMAFSATQPALGSRISAYCFDLHQPFFRENTFELIFGSAIVHHLVDPLAALRHVASSLKPGGRMVLVEPMEAGSLLLTTLYEAVITEMEVRGEVNHPIARLMVAMRTDIHARLGVPVRKPWTERLDDKWVFNRPYLSRLARELDCRLAKLLPAQPDLLHVYEDSFRSLLADSGNGDVQIPDYVLSVVRSFDNGIGADLKMRLFPTGIVIFEK